jgi:hypothetical protein
VRMLASISTWSVMAVSLVKAIGGRGLLGKLSELPRLPAWGSSASAKTTGIGRSIDGACPKPVLRHAPNILHITWRRKMIISKVSTFVLF